MELLGVAFLVGDELGGNLLGGAAEEGVGEVPGGRGGYGGGLVEINCTASLPNQQHHLSHGALKLSNQEGIASSSGSR